MSDTDSACDTYAAADVTLGQLYYLPLDGTGDVFVPVSLETTT
jgi:hypothetical protein